MKQTNFQLEPLQIIKKITHCLCEIEHIDKKLDKHLKMCPPNRLELLSDVAYRKQLKRQQREWSALFFPEYQKVLQNGNFSDETLYIDKPQFKMKATETLRLKTQRFHAIKELQYWNDATEVALKKDIDASHPIAQFINSYIFHIDSVLAWKQ